MNFNKLSNNEWIALIILSLLLFTAPLVATVMACVMSVLKRPKCFWDWLLTKTKGKE